MTLVVLTDSQLQTSALYQEWVQKLQHYNHSALQAEAILKKSPLPQWLLTAPKVSNPAANEVKALCFLSDQNEVEACVWFRTFAGICEIDHVFTWPKVRGGGRAKALLLGLCQHLRQESEAREVWLEVEERNAAAIGLYESLGFVQEQRRKDYYGVGRHALNYRLNLL